MLMMKDRRPAFRTLEGWARSILLEASAIWICGFYPGSEPGEYTDGTAATFDKASAPPHGRCLAAPAFGAS